MNVPNHTENEVVEIIDKVVSILAPKFVFGYFDVEDIEQEGRYFALEALPRYDPSKPLANFLYVHVHNRLVNFKRKNFSRLDNPCPKCHNENYCNKDAQPCKKYRKWLKRNQLKANIAKPISIDCVADENEGATRQEDDIVERIYRQELRDLIDKELPVDLRSGYLKMLDGVNISAAQKKKVVDKLREIVCQKKDD